MNSQQAQHRLQQLAAEASAIFDKADAEGRQLMPEEREEAEEKVARFKDLQARQQVFGVAERIGTPGVGGLTGGDGRPLASSDAGLAFVESEGYKAISDPETRGQKWSTGAIPIGSLHAKGTLLEGAGAPGAGSGGGFLSPGPTVVPGVVETLFQPIEAVDLFATITTNTNTVRYAIEGTATSGAAGVAEGAAKPESTLGLSTTDEPVKKIATSITVSDELISDATSAQGFIGGRLSKFVTLEEERQLLRGAGTNELVGLVGRGGVNTYARGSDDNLTAIAKVIANTAGSSHVMPTGVVMHPTNWLASRLLRDGSGGTVGAYFGAGPFGPAAQNAGAAGLFGQSLWDVPVALSTTVGPGTAIVGGFANCAAIARRSGVVVEATNSHSDYFTRDLVVVRAEQREALLVYRPSAFTVVSGLS
jgi:HK97 family phage major capsid protein